MGVLELVSNVTNFKDMADFHSAVDGSLAAGLGSKLLQRLAEGAINHGVPHDSTLKDSAAVEFVAPSHCPDAQLLCCALEAHNAALRFGLHPEVDALKVLGRLLNLTARFLEERATSYAQRVEHLARLELVVGETRSKYFGTYTACHSDMVKKEAGYEDALAEAQRIVLAVEGGSINQPFQDLVTLFAASAKVQGVLDELCAQCVRVTGHGKTSPGKLKGLLRGAEKCWLNGGNVGAICDVSRNMIVFDDMLGMVAALQHLSANKRIRIVRLKNRWAKPSSGGWADILMNVIFVSGCDASVIESNIICEIQLVHKHMLTVRSAMGGHDGYTSFRSAEELLEMTFRTHDSGVKVLPP